MGYLKIVSYLYIIFAVGFLIDGIYRIQQGEDPIISFLFSGLAVFMFFFRRRFAKKFAERDNEKNK